MYSASSHSKELCANRINIHPEVIRFENTPKPNLFAFHLSVLMENEKVSVNENRAALYQNTFTKYLSVPIRVIETAVTALWNRQIVTVHSLF
jgi:hypothetical protein